MQRDDSPSQESYQAFVRAVLLTLLVLVSFVSNKFYNWYPLSYLALALLLPSGQLLRQYALASSCCFLISGFTFLNRLRVIGVLLTRLLPLALMREPLQSIQSFYKISSSRTKPIPVDAG
jgi:hypothetical protein